MVTSKRLTNTTGLKVAFIPATNNKNDQFKITQTNFCKSVTISGNLDVRITDFICSVLDGIEDIKGYSLVVDNSQSKHNLFSVDFNGD
jgi:hypothetical protein